MIAVELKNSHKMIGNVYIGKRDFEGLEIGYVFNRNYWGYGYAAESCKTLIQQAFSNGVHMIYAECDPDNKSSWKLLEALEFKCDVSILKSRLIYRKIVLGKGFITKHLPLSEPRGFRFRQVIQLFFALLNGIAVVTLHIFYRNFYLIFWVWFTSKVRPF